MTETVPLVDLKASHRRVASEVQAGFDRVLTNTSFILGEEVTLFEEEFAKFSGSKHCIGVGNGTDALELALRAIGLGPEDEVILPANTYVATALAVARLGARPILVDCDPDHLLIDVEQVAAAVTPRTRAIIPVHLYGQMAPMENLVPLARDHGLHLIEDAAQAHGAKRNHRQAGTFGVAAGVSFYPGKNLGAYGDGGAVLTDDPAIDRKIRLLRNHGSEVKYQHVEIGFNSRLDTLQAVVLRAKLKHLAESNAARRQAAHNYSQMLSNLNGVGLPMTLPGNEHVYHLYVVRVANRDKVIEQLHAEGIGAQIHYPVPIHLQGSFRHLDYRAGDFPVAEQAANEILSLPIFPEITSRQLQRVTEGLIMAVEHHAG